MGGYGRSGNDPINALYLYGKLSDSFHALDGGTFDGNAHRRFHADASFGGTGCRAGADDAFRVRQICLYGKAEAIFPAVPITAAMQLYRVGHPKRARAGHVDGAGSRKRLSCGHWCGFWEPA